MRNEQPTHIGTNRQLFVDDFWIADAKGITRRLHAPVPREIAIAAEHPWERGGVSYMVTFRDGDRFRAWYRCDQEMPIRGERQPLIAYAESTDGVHWNKPRLGLIEFQGSKDNNLVWTGPGNNMSPFLDGNPDAPDEERYKAIVRTRDVLALVSRDGLSWRLMQDAPILTDRPFDSHNIAFWDAWRSEYVAYTRGVAGKGNFKSGVRWIRRTTSKDFRHWTPLESIDAGDAPFEHLYTNACVPYERASGTYLMFPSRFVVEREPIPDWEYGSGVNDIVFMSSRDGLHFDRSFMEAFVRPGLDADNWHERGIYMERGILHTSPGELSLYGMQNWRMPTVHIRRFTLRTDGFVSVNAGYAGGEFTTTPFVFIGRTLALNYSTSAVGCVQVEIQDAHGQTQPGFGIKECPQIFGDEIDGVVRWEDGADVSALAGKPVRLRFMLKDADLFAFRFGAAVGSPGEVE
ncbi:MAG: hypothetical protein O7E52_29410 [Candidatus Poribacteria bacterium]|nr:hypothetical protein [Candidatus Poribacteria bacterium]